MQDPPFSSLVLCFVKCFKDILPQNKKLKIGNSIKILSYLFNKIQALSIVCPVNILPNESFPKENKAGLFIEIILVAEIAEAGAFILQITAKSACFYTQLRQRLSKEAKVAAN